MNNTWLRKHGPTLVKIEDFFVSRTTKLFQVVNNFSWENRKPFMCGLQKLNEKC